MMATEYNKDLICFASFIDIYGIRRKNAFFTNFSAKKFASSQLFFYICTQKTKYLIT